MSKVKMTNQKKTFVMCVIAYAIISMLNGCAFMLDVRYEPTNISQLAYDVDPYWGYTVFVLEDGVHVPYLVLTDNYNGTGYTLLLRKHLIEDRIRWNGIPANQRIGPPALFQESEMDEFLNKDFLERLAEPIQELVVNTPILVTSPCGWVTGGHTLYIHRKVFLLARSEIYGRLSRVVFIEGELLAYFSSAERRIAYREDGIAASWWTRTPMVGQERTIVTVITHSGWGGGGPLMFTTGEGIFGIRPAFCLPGDTPIIRGELNGEDVFFIDVPNHGPPTQNMFSEIAEPYCPYPYDEGADIQDNEADMAYFEEQKLTEYVAQAVHHAFIMKTDMAGYITIEQSAYRAGTTIVLFVITPEGYEFEGWTTTAGAIKSPTNEFAEFIMPDGPATITAHFRRMDG